MYLLGGLYPSVQPVDRGKRIKKDDEVMLNQYHSLFADEAYVYRQITNAVRTFKILKEIRDNLPFMR